jgi:hypothetical protein
LTAFLFLQRFDNGAPAPMPFEAVMEVLSRHGVAGRGRGDAEFTFEADQVAAVCTVAGSTADGAACIGFERPRFDSPLRRAVWECMASFGCTAFTDTLDTVYATAAPPADLLAGCVNGARLVSTAQQLWPEQLELTAPPVARPALLYTNPNPNGPRHQFCDGGDFDAKELCIELAIRPEACNRGTLRIVRNLELRLDAAISANPEYRLVYRYAHHESSLRLMESARIGEHANPVTLVSPPPGDTPPHQIFVADRDVLAGAQAEADKLTRHVQDKYQLALDGSSASIDALARLLDKVHAFYCQERGKHPADGAPFHSALATSWALKAGCYLGTVIQRQLAGQWGYVERGLQRLPVVLTHSGSALHPHLQVLDHIINGPRDSIAGWFARLAETDAPAAAQSATPDAAAIEGWPQDPSMASALAEVRASLDTWRAGATPDDYLDLREGDSAWLRDDPLGAIVNAQAMLLSKGTVVWGALVLANGDLFEPGPDDKPAALVYSRDPHFDGRPQALRRIASALLAPTGNDTPLPLRVLAGRVQAGKDRFQNLPVPTSVSERKVLVSTFAVFRQHLPGGVMAGRSWFPVLVHPYTHAMMIVPRQFWPAGLSASWEAGELSA